MSSVEVKRRDPEALKRLGDRLKETHGREVAIGFLPDQGQVYPDGTPVVEVAAAHVFGVGVPERDFMSLGKSMLMPKVAPMLRSIAKLSASTTGQSGRAIQDLQEAIGQTGQREIRAAIVDGDWEPNSPYPMSDELREKVSESWDIDIPPGMSYLEAKKKYRGSDKPLVDTGHMLQSVLYVVRDRKSSDAGVVHV